MQLTSANALHQLPRISIDTNDEFRHLDNVILSIMSFPVRNGCHTKHGSLQLVHYFKDEWPDEFQKCSCL